MKLAIMQPYFFPYIGYFQLIHAADKMIFYADVPFSNHSWMDRNRLRYRNGSEFFFNAPVVGRNGQIIRDVGLDASKVWLKSFHKVLRCNYGGAPFYNETIDLILRSMAENATGEPGSLMRTNVATVCDIVRYLDIDTEIEAHAFAYPDIEEQIKSLPKEERMTRRITEICKCNHAKNYVNAIGGTTLYSKERFLQEGIRLEFISTRPYRYDQQAKAFIAGLSIIDVLMHCGREGAKRLLTTYDLI